MKTALRLLAEIEAFLACYPDMSPAAFGEASCGIHKLVRRLREGRGVSSTTIDLVTDYMTAYRLVHPGKQKKTKAAAKTTAKASERVAA